MNESIRIGVVGVGSIGKNHARICAGIKEAKFVAIYDSNSDVAKSIGRQYRVPVASSLAFTRPSAIYDHCAALPASVFPRA